MIIETEPADIICVSGSGFISSAIQFVEGSEISHIAGSVCINDYIVEAHIDGVHARSLNEYADGRCKIAVFRNIKLDKRTKVRIAEEALRFVNDKYGVIKILAHLIDRTIFRGAYVVRRICGLSNFPICSYLWAKAYYDCTLYKFGCEVNAAEPSDMYNWCLSNSQDWKCVYELNYYKG
jgi:hypothetical protein